MYFTLPVDIDEIQQVEYDMYYIQYMYLTLPVDIDK
jgi:hypothetical protein